MVILSQEFRVLDDNLDTLGEIMQNDTTLRMMYIYQIVDVKTHEFYVGKRVSRHEDPERDVYWGSGVNRICRSARKHFGEGYRKDILIAGMMHQSRLRELESMIVNEQLLLDPLCLNLALGGKGGGIKGKPATDEWKLMMFNAHIGKSLSLEHKEKISATLRMKNGDKVAKKKQAIEDRKRKRNEEKEAKLLVRQEKRAQPKHHTIEVRSRIAEAARQNWKDPEFRQKTIQARLDFEAKRKK